MPGSGFTLGAGAASESRFQVQLHARGRGRKTEGHSPSLLIQLPGESSREVTSLLGEASPRQFVLLKQEGEKVPERRDTGIALQ